MPSTTSPHLRRSLTPHYAEKFRCIGPACEDDCCHSWDITLDRPTYERYGTLPDGPLRNIVDANVLLRVQTPATEAQPDRFYGEVKLLANGACPFFSAERLCRIQTELGPESLSAVCASFPRITRSIDHQTETALQLSCPEAARLVLLNPRFMHLPRTEPGGYSRYAPFARTAAERLPPDGNPYQYLWELRYFVFLVLKDRTYPLWQRLFIIGMLTKRLTEVAAAVPAGETVPALLRSYAELMQQGRLRPAMAELPSQPEKHLTLILQLLERRAALGPIPPRLLDCIRAFFAGIGYTADQPVFAALPGYRAAQSSTSAALKRHEYMLENYLINYVMLNRFPFGDDLAPTARGTTAIEAHALMCVRFTLLCTLAIGMAAHLREEFSPAHLVTLVQSFSKSFEHNLDVRAAVVGTITAHNLTTTAGLATLLPI